jgi:hypothetical protein
VLQKNFSCGRRHHAAPAPFEQHIAHRLFELQQPLADRGSHDVVRLGCARDVSRLAHRHEQAQGGQVEIAHAGPWVFDIPERNAGRSNLPLSPWLGNP